MNRTFLRGLAPLVLVACLFLGTAVAQSTQSSSAAPSGESANVQADPNAGDANAGIGDILARTTEQAAHSAEKWGRSLGIGPKTSFTISIGFNFLVLFAFCYVLMKSRLPQAFRERTAAIQKGIKEAQAASAEATRRLSDIEARLSKLDAEVEQIRTSAEREAVAEEERIRKAAEEDKQKVIAAAEVEIDAIARNARRELKGYVAGLAVDLAAQRVRVDDATDHALVREFAEQLGKDGK